jgi:hypothetical protein
MGKRKPQHMYDWRGPGAPAGFPGQKRVKKPSNVIRPEIPPKNGIGDRCPRGNGTEVFAPLFQFFFD